MPSSIIKHGVSYVSRFQKNKRIPENIHYIKLLFLNLKKSNYHLSSFSFLQYCTVTMPQIFHNAAKLPHIQEIEFTQVSIIYINYYQYDLSYLMILHATGNAGDNPCRNIDQMSFVSHADLGPSGQVIGHYVTGISKRCPNALVCVRYILQFCAI